MQINGIGARALWKKAGSRTEVPEVGFLKSCLESRAVGESQVPIFGRFLLLVTT